MSGAPPSGKTTNPRRGSRSLSAALRLTACLVVALLGGGCLSFSTRVETVESRTLGLEGVRSLVVRTASGHVIVHCDPNVADLRVQVKRFGQSSSEEDARRLLEKVEVSLELDPQRNDVLRIEAIVPRSLRGRNSAGAGFVLSLPPGMDFKIETENGPVEVDGAKGDVSIQSQNGGIAVRRSEGDFEMQSANGDIRFDGVRGATIQASTANGNIYGTDFEGDSRFSTDNGAIRLRLARGAVRPRIHAESSNGSIRIETPASLSAQVSFSTDNGGIRADLDEFNASDVVKNRHRFRAALNGAEGIVEARTSNGGIELRPLP